MLTESNEKSQALLEKRLEGEDGESYQDHRRKIEEVNKSVISRLTKVSLFCTTFMFIELIGGYIAGSLAIMTDAAHLLSDLSGFLISIVSLYIATRPANFELTYGYHRAEVIGALASVLIIWVLTLWLLTEAINRLINPQPIEGSIMFSISILGLIFNIIMGRILANDDLPNAFEKPEVEEEEKIDDKDSLVLKAAQIHVLGDMIQSGGVIIAGAIIYFFEASYPGIVIVDPICTFLFCIIVIFTTIPVTTECLNVLMEASPKEVNIKALTEELGEVTGVVDIHDVHLWSISMGKPSISLHISSNTPQKTLEAATNVCKKHKIYHITIQVEDWTQRRRASFIDCNHRIENAIH